MRRTVIHARDDDLIIAGIGAAVNFARNWRKIQIFGRLVGQEIVVSGVVARPVGVVRVKKIAGGIKDVNVVVCFYFVEVKGSSH